MDKKEIIYEVVNKYKNTDIEINDDLKLKEDLGINSIEGLKIMLDLEEKGLSFVGGNIGSINTISDLINVLKVK
jgi:acyl carrier protein